MHLKSVLDDLERVKAVDRENMCEIQERLPENCEDAIEVAESLRIPPELRVSEEIVIKYEKPEKIIVAGMGGSAIGGELLKDWLRDTVPIPIEVCRDYTLPAYADEKTLVLAVSYSGNTEETLSGFLEAVGRGCMVVAMSSGGVLQKFSEKLKIPFVKLPEGLPAPRCAVPYLFFPLAIALEKLGIMPDAEEEFREAITVLKQTREELRLETPTQKNLAKKLAVSVKGSIPIVYGFRSYNGVALRMKTQFNENSKIPSKCEAFPELNHNEVVGWMAPKELTENFTIILIRDAEEPPEIAARIEATRELVLDETAKKVLEIYARGKTKLARMLSVMYIGDFTSVYLAILCDVDPTPVEIITKVKRRLEREINTIERLRERLERITKT